MSRDTDCRALAHIVNTLRPDWGTPGIIAALRQADDKPLAALALAAIHATERTDQRTPAFIPRSGEHWRETPTKAPTPAPPSLRSDAICQGCARDRAGHDRINALAPNDAHPWVSRADWAAREGARRG